MIKGTDKDWLRLTKEVIKKGVYGVMSTCPFCLFAGYNGDNNLVTCKKCLILKVSRWCYNSNSYGKEYPIEIQLLEFKVALENYIRENT